LCECIPSIDFDFVADFVSLGPNGRDRSFLLSSRPEHSSGSLRAGHGSRFVLADTEELHTRIAQMSQRIRQLEDALSVSHSGDSKDRHPLLHDELLSLKFGSDLQQVKEEPDDEISLPFGTLTLTDSGGSKYFGASAGPLVGFFLFLFKFRAKVAAGRPVRRGRIAVWPRRSISKYSAPTKFIFSQSTW
jgi:hypothetical protein